MPVLTPEEVLFFKEEGVRPDHLCCAVLLAIAPLLIIAAAVLCCSPSRLLTAAVCPRST